VKHARNFLEEGHKVKAFVFFRGRSIVFKERGEILLLKFAQELEDVGVVESMPKLEGKRMTMFLVPKKKK
jgi:translation initiation factor IF-3